jgi:hypothetical protein
MEGDVPEFTLTGDRYDQRTYYGRFIKMLNICDPSMLLYSRSRIQEAVDRKSVV